MPLPAPMPGVCGRVRDAGPRAHREGRNAGAMPELLATALLQTDGLTRHFKIGGALSRQTLHAVDDVSITIGEREIVALAGESGSGKSTVARLLARLYRPTSGSVTFAGEPLARVRSR